MNDNFRKDIKDDKLFFSVVKSGFAQRRKRLVNSVSSGGQVSKEEIISALEFLGIDENIRIEQLDEKTLKAFVNRLTEKRS
jgi:16S rRNA (adenine1518-N6/adenine1519-N6)-dimethyltransferase